MRRWPLLLLLASGLAFLASLYLPWQRARLPDSAAAHLFGDVYESTGWTAFGYASALFALALVAGSGAALFRPRLGATLPLGRCALFVGYGAAAVAVGLWYERHYPATADHGRLHLHFAYGAYLGFAAGAAAVVGACALRARGLREDISVRRCIAAAGAVGLLVALALPWVHSDAADASGPAYDAGAAVGATFPALWAPFVPLLAPVPLLFAGGIVSEVAPSGDIVYGAWIGLAAATLLLCTGTFRRPPLPLFLPSVAFLATLFLRWQGPFTGWTVLTAVCAALAVGMLVVALIRLPVSLLELAAAFALFLATQGFELAHSAQSPDYEVRIGAVLGYVAGAALCAAVLVSSRHVRLPRDRLALRALAVIGAALCIVVLLVPTWEVLPGGAWSNIRFIPSSWFGIACVLLAIRVGGVWLRSSVHAGEAFLLPVALLTLVVLELIRERAYRLNAGGWIVVGVSLLLALLGWLEQRGGLKDFRVPEVLRVDRL